MGKLIDTGITDFNAKYAIDYLTEKMDKLSAEYNSAKCDNERTQRIEKNIAELDQAIDVLERSRPRAAM